MTLKYGGFDPNKKHRNPPADPTLMRLAQEENFALFLLTGMRSSCNGVRRYKWISPTILKCMDVMIRAIDLCIEDIKDLQELRKQARKLKK